MRCNADLQGTPWSLRLGWPDCLQWDPSWCCQQQEHSGGGSCRKYLVRVAHSCASGGLEVRLVTGAFCASPAHGVGSPALMMSSKETGCFFPSAMVVCEGLYIREGVDMVSSYGVGMRKRGCDRMGLVVGGGHAVFVCRERALHFWLKLVFGRALPGTFVAAATLALASCGSTTHLTDSSCKHAQKMNAT